MNQLGHSGSLFWTNGVSLSSLKLKGQLFILCDPCLFCLLCEQIPLVDVVEPLFTRLHRHVLTGNAL